MERAVACGGEPSKWLLHRCCPYGMDDLSPELLDELARDERLARCVFQSAYVDEEQYHLIDMALELGRPAFAAQFMALLGGNPFPRKKWEVPYQKFETLCIARSREAAEQEIAERIPDTEKRIVPQISAAEPKKSGGRFALTCIALAVLCGGIFAYRHWSGSTPSTDEPPQPAGGLRRSGRPV